MGVNRREFLKIAGISTVLGLGGTAAINVLRPGQVDASHPAPAQEEAVEAAAGAIRWAMAVDVSKCIEKEGCKECINACHTTHNVPDFGNPKDEIKWIWKEKYEYAFPLTGSELFANGQQEKPFMLLCNHCDKPACVRVCPTKATFRRADGIVMMDMHRCIGCRFCMAACPFGARSFNWRDPRPHVKSENPDYPTRTRGVVEKCTFCTERLAKNLLPACVEACKEKALIFGDLEDPESAVRGVLRERFSIRRKPELGTQPSVFYLV